MPGAELWMQEEEQTEEKAKMVTIAFLTAVWPGVKQVCRGMCVFCCVPLTLGVTSVVHHQVAVEQCKC